MKVLRRFTTLVEAEAVRCRLAAANIESHVSGTDHSQAFAMGGAPLPNGVRLEVHQDHFDRADELLNQDFKQLMEAGDWECPKCSEINEPAFEICWSCQTPRPDGSIGIQTSESPDPPLHLDENITDSNGT